MSKKHKRPPERRSSDPLARPSWESEPRRCSCEGMNSDCVRCGGSGTVEFGNPHAGSGLATPDASAGVLRSVSQSTERVIPEYQPSAQHERAATSNDPSSPRPTRKLRASQQRQVRSGRGKKSRIKPALAARPAVRCNYCGSEVPAERLAQHLELVHNLKPSESRRTPRQDKRVLRSKEKPQATKPSKRIERQRVRCSECGKLVAASGLAQHCKDKHGPAPATGSITLD